MLLEFRTFILVTGTSVSFVRLKHFSSFVSNSIPDFVPTKIDLLNPEIHVTSLKFLETR